MQPVSPTPKYRWTAYAGGIPVGHGATRFAALDHAELRAGRDVRVDWLCLRLREYPFTRLGYFPPLP